MTSLIHRAICKNDANLVMKYINDGVDLNEVSQDGFNMTPLHFVAITDSAKVCRALCEAGAKPNRRAMRGMTPLHIAAIFHSDASTEVLSRYRGDFYAKTDDGFTPDKLADKSFEFRQNYWDSLDTYLKFESVVRRPSYKVKIAASISTPETPLLGNAQRATPITKKKCNDMLDEIQDLRDAVLVYTALTMKHLNEIDTMFAKLNSKDA